MLLQSQKTLFLSLSPSFSLEQAGKKKKFPKNLYVSLLKYSPYLYIIMDETCLLLKLLHFTSLPYNKLALISFTIDWKIWEIFQFRMTGKFGLINVGGYPNKKIIFLFHCKIQLCDSKASQTVTDCFYFWKYFFFGNWVGWHIYKHFRNYIAKHFSKKMTFVIIVLPRNSISSESYHFDDIWY